MTPFSMYRCKFLCFRPIFLDLNYTAISEVNERPKFFIRQLQEF